MSEKTAAVNIRSMTPDDYDAVKELWSASGEVPLNPVDDSREGITRYLKRNPTTSFVAESDGRLVGTIMAGHDGRRGFFHHVYVAPDRRGEGIGKKLTQSAILALKNEGITKVALVAFRTNEKGNTFWESLGFTARDDLFYRNKLIIE